MAYPLMRVTQPERANVKTYKTSLDKEIEIKPIPPLLVAKVQQAISFKADSLYPATKPTYEVVDAGGGVQTFEHNADSVSTPEERAAWDEYQTAQQKRTTYLNEQMLNFFLSRGLVIELPADDGWATSQEYWGVEVPTDPQKRLLHYIQTEILGSAQDIEGLTVAIMGATGVDGEALDAARASFRGDVRQGTRADHLSGGEIPVSEAGSALDDFAAVPRIANGQIVGAYPIAMG